LQNPRKKSTLIRFSWSICLTGNQRPILNQHCPSNYIKKKEYVLEVRFGEHLNFLFRKLVLLQRLLSNLTCKTNNEAKKKKKKKKKKKNKKIINIIFV